MQAIEFCFQLCLAFQWKLIAGRLRAGVKAGKVESE